MSLIGKLRTSIVLASVGAVSLALAACGGSVSVGTPTVNQEELQTNVQTQLTKLVGEQAPPIVCPDTLDAKVGSTTTCTLTDSSGTYNVTVKVTSVDGGTAKFDIQVADKPNS
ncbi:unannotated protein [freshwater metagenome]|uniref:Unannotated protein n=1 Tax=freshwater metagenome TaxID=449393 RepID=A0A6J5ZKE2_9ZZZZ